MTWVKDGSIYVKCEVLDVPDEPRTLRPGWTIRELPGIGIINPKVFLTPIQRLYIDILKYGRRVLRYEQRDGYMYVSTVVDSNQPETYMQEYRLEPRK